jgi:hypothetical protein
VVCGLVDVDIVGSWPGGLVHLVDWCFGCLWVGGLMDWWLVDWFDCWVSTRFLTFYTLRYRISCILGTFLLNLFLCFLPVPLMDWERLIGGWADWYFLSRGSIDGIVVCWIGGLLPLFTPSIKITTSSQSMHGLMKPMSRQKEYLVFHCRDGKLL